MTSESPRSRAVEPATTIHLPTPPGDIVRPSFPVLATVAPVLASVALWALTQSPFALLFALLGPVVAVASLGDNSWHGRRNRRRELERFEEDSRAVEESIRDRQSTERAALDVEFPAIGELIDDRGMDDAWHGGGEAMVRVGTGDAPSPIRIEGGVIRHRIERVRDRLVELQQAAARLPESAIVVDAGGGIGYCGVEIARVAAARAGVIRLARLLDPTLWTIRTRLSDRSLAAWRWLDALPHRRDAGDPVDDRADRIEFVSVPDVRGAPDTAGRAALVALAVAPDDLPRRCGTVVVLESGSGTITKARGRPRALRPEFVTADEARTAADGLTARARRAGLLESRDDIAHEIPLSSLANPASPSSAGLACEAGATAGGRWVVDLVADGPHAVVGGVTGSGKSELLTSWLLAMATRYTPDDVTFLLVDFKGGATFGAISLLPHSVGLITDLDRVQARRALESLRAELAYRERALATAKVRSVGELPESSTLSRLVIVVDEFAALSGDFPELRELFADLAARGRSLGIHLILCTQRPAATLRDAILANCTLRICLRVNDAADSIALLGTGAAAALPRAPVGRAFVSAGGEPPTLIQVAIATLDDAAAVAMAKTPLHPVRRPWCDALPSMIDLADLDRGTSHDAAIPFGLLDLPHAQQQSVAVWEPRVHGNLLVLGGFGAGTSTALTAIAAGSASPIVIPAEVEAGWDGLLYALDLMERAGPAPRIVVVDDVDALIARFAGDHQQEFAESLLRLLRDGPASGTFTVLSARSVPSALGRIASACDSRLLLRMPDRSEHVVAGGRGADFDERMQPGGGYFRGDRVQVGWTATRPTSPGSAVAELDFTAGTVTAVISAAPREFTAAIGERATSSVPLRVVDIVGSDGSTEITVSDPKEHLILVGDPDAWQSGWTRLPAIRSRARLVFHRASTADFRTITRSRRLPPALSGDPGRLWVVDLDDTVRRATLPGRLS